MNVVTTVDARGAASPALLARPGALIEATGIVACHLYAADMAASFTRTTESERRAFDVPPWTALVEASTAEAAAAAMGVVGDELARQRIDAPVDGTVYALEVCRLSVNESLE